MFRAFGGWPANAGLFHYCLPVPPFIWDMLGPVGWPKSFQCVSPAAFRSCWDPQAWQCRCFLRLSPSRRVLLNPASCLTWGSCLCERECRRFALVDVAGQRGVFDACLPSFPFIWDRWGWPMLKLVSTPLGTPGVVSAGAFNACHRFVIPCFFWFAVG